MTTQLRIDSIRLDGGTQPRAAMNFVTIEEYAQAMLEGAAFPPVVVFYDGADYWLADGFHRAKAAERAEWTEIDADVRQGTRDDAIDYACSGEPNSKHGLRETPADRERRVKTMIAKHPDWSTRKIAAHCGVGHDTVWRWSKDICPNQTDKMVERNGTTYTMNTENIGRPADPSQAFSDEQPEREMHRPTPEECEAMAERMEQQGQGLSREEWDAMPYEYVGDCSKQCYAPRVMTKGDVYEYGVRGVYVCSSCGYAYPPQCQPEPCECDRQDLGEEAEQAAENSTPSNAPSDFAGLHFSSDSVECYTPHAIIARVLEVFGEIDLDPCSNSHETPNVPARQHFTQADNGLAHEWHGKVYMNPPYGRELGDWTACLVGQYRQGHVTEAIALVPSRTDTEWFKQLREFPRCFLFGRLRFIGQENSAPFPSMAVYIGNNLPAFLEAFQDIGDVYRLA